MGGEIGVKSQPEKGSNFWFTSSFLKQANTRHKPGHIPKKIKTLKCLVVDDTDSCRKILTQHLHSYGCIADHAQNHTMAMEKLMDAQLEQTPFNTIFIDLEMPGFDGIAVAGIIQANKAIKCPELILMSYTTKRMEPEIFKKAGFKAQLIKPVYKNHVLACLIQAHAMESPKGGTNSRFSLEEPRAILDIADVSLNILLAEDNRMNQKVAANMLKKLGHKVTIARNGEEAVEMFQTNPFHLILMDGQMPVMDGLEATRAIRNLEKVMPSPPPHIPIIALTADAMKGDKERFLASGMDNYITKPIKRKSLENAILHSISRQPAATGKDTPIDLDELIQTMGGNKYLVKECFDTFCNTHGKMLAQIKGHIDDHNLPPMANALEGFRDSVKNLSCKPLMNAAFSLDRAVTAGDNVEIQKKFNALAHTCARLEDFIATYSVKNLFMKFLIVDIGFDSRKKSQKTLSEYGECDVAVNGIEALNAFIRAHNEKDPYHLIFLDFEIQDLDGIQVIKKIRQWERSKAISRRRCVKIALFLMKSQKDSVASILEPEYETCMEKPVTRERLATAFQQLKYT